MFMRCSSILMMRASISLPGIFAPVPWEGALLVDGGLVNPVPVSLARAMGADPANWRESLREVGRLLAFLKEPEPPKGLKDAWQNTRPVFMKVLDMAPKERSSAPCQDVVWEGADVDLARLPVQTCWPQDAGPLRVWFRDLIILARGPSGWLIETNVDQPTTEALYEADLARLPFRRTVP